jgi:hypothetical protein
MMKTITFLVLCFLSFLPVGALAKTIVEASTEAAIVGGMPPPAKLVDAILAIADDTDLATFSDCLREVKTEKNESRKFFRAVPLPKSSGTGLLYFVRPALKPYCQSFYGAHLFRYWIVLETGNRSSKSYDVRYAGVADSVDVLSSRHQGYPDIIETNCWAVGCGSATLQYDGAKYVATDCRETTSSVDGKEITKGVSCPEAYSNRTQRR